MSNNRLMIRCRCGGWLTFAKYSPTYWGTIPDVGPRLDAFFEEHAEHWLDDPQPHDVNYGTWITVEREDNPEDESEARWHNVEMMDRADAEDEA